MPVTIAPRRPLAAALATAMALSPAATVAQEESPSPSTTIAPVSDPAGDWVVVAYDAWEQGLAEPLPDSTLIVSLLENGQLEGETACGRFNGGWSVEGAELFVGVAPSGNLGCADEQTVEAIGLSTALGAATSWRATDAGIELLDVVDNTRVALSPLAAGDPTGGWSVVRFRRPNGELREPHADGPMSMTLAEDGAIAGSSGCRSLVGQYERDGAGITLGPLEVDGQACEDGVARAERQLLRALGEAVYWRQVGDTLTLLDGFDAPLVELDRLAEDEE